MCGWFSTPLREPNLFLPKEEEISNQGQHDWNFRNFQLVALSQFIHYPLPVVRQLSRRQQLRRWDTSPQVMFCSGSDVYSLFGSCVSFGRNSVDETALLDQRRRLKHHLLNFQKWLSWPVIFGAYFGMLRRNNICTYWSFKWSSWSESLVFALERCVAITFAKKATKVGAYGTAAVRLYSQ